MGLQAARDAARKLIERVESGAAPQPAPVHPRSALTLGGLIDKYETLRQAEGHRTKMLAGSMASLRQHLEPWLSVPAAQFSKADLRAARDALVEAGTLVAANRLLGYLGPVMRWGAQEDLIPANFVRDIRKFPRTQAVARSHRSGTCRNLAGLRPPRRRCIRKGIRPPRALPDGHRATQERG